MSATRDIQTVLREQVIPAGASRHGLVIGVERYRDARLNLRCARADAQAIYDLMTDPECGLFPKENVKLLVDEEATKENIWRSLSSLLPSVGSSDTVWIFYAGHAAPERSRVFWVTHDADVDNLRGTALDREHIDGLLEDIPASRLLVMLDCCHAAATAAQKNRTRDLLTPEELFASYTGEGRITLASSDGKEKSVELTGEGHGAFTYFLKQGLRGAADADGDGVVTANELWDYLRDKVTDASHKAGNKQTPVLLGQMQHHLALTLNPRATQHKRQLEQVLRQHVGWDDKSEFSTDEGAWCRKLIHDGPRSDDEWAVYEELKRLVDGHALVSTIKRLVRIARATHTTKPAPAPVETRKPVEEPTQDQAEPDEPAVAPEEPSITRDCPSCGNRLNVRPGSRHNVTCPRCKSVLQLKSDFSALSIVEDDREQSGTEREPPAKKTPATRKPAAAPEASPVSRTCPACDDLLEVHPKSAGRTITCPGCKAVLHVESDLSGLTIIRESREKPVWLNCPACDKHLEVEADSADREIRCHGCKSVLRVASDLSSLSLIEQPRKKQETKTEPPPSPPPPIQKRQPSNEELPAHVRKLIDDAKCVEAFDVVSKALREQPNDNVFDLWFHVASYPLDREYVVRSARQIHDRRHDVWSKGALALALYEANRRDEASALLGPSAGGAEPVPLQIARLFLLKSSGNDFKSLLNNLHRLRPANVRLLALKATVDALKAINDDDKRAIPQTIGLIDQALALDPHLPEAVLFREVCRFHTENDPIALSTALNNAITHLQRIVPGNLWINVLRFYACAQVLIDPDRSEVKRLSGFLCFWTEIGDRRERAPQTIGPPRPGDETIYLLYDASKLGNMIPGFYFTMNHIIWRPSAASVDNYWIEFRDIDRTTVLPAGIQLNDFPHPLPMADGVFWNGARMRTLMSRMIDKLAAMRRAPIGFTEFGDLFKNLVPQP